MDRDFVRAAALLRAATSALGDPTSTPQYFLTAHPSGVTRPGGARTAAFRPGPQFSGKTGLLSPIDGTGQYFARDNALGLLDELQYLRDRNGYTYQPAVGQNENHVRFLAWQLRPGLLLARFVAQSRNLDAGDAIFAWTELAALFPEEREVLPLRQRSHIRFGEAALTSYHGRLYRELRDKFVGYTIGPRRFLLLRELASALDAFATAILRVHTYQVRAAAYVICALAGRVAESCTAIVKTPELRRDFESLERAQFSAVYDFSMRANNYQATRDEETTRGLAITAQLHKDSTAVYEHTLATRLKVDRGLDSLYTEADTYFRDEAVPAAEEFTQAALQLVDVLYFCTVDVPLAPSKTVRLLRRKGIGSVGALAKQNPEFHGALLALGFDYYLGVGGQPLTAPGIPDTPTLLVEWLSLRVLPLLGAVAGQPRASFATAARELYSALSGSPNARGVLELCNSTQSYATLDVRAKRHSSILPKSLREPYAQSLARDVLITARTDVYTEALDALQADPENTELLEKAKAAESDVRALATSPDPMTNPQVLLQHLGAEVYEGVFAKPGKATPGLEAYLLHGLELLAVMQERDALLGEARPTRIRPDVYALARGATADLGASEAWEQKFMARTAEFMPRYIAIAKAFGYYYHVRDLFLGVPLPESLRADRPSDARVAAMGELLKAAGSDPDRFVLALARYNTESLSGKTFKKTNSDGKGQSVTRKVAHATSVGKYAHNQTKSANKPKVKKKPPQKYDRVPFTKERFWRIMTLVKAARLPGDELRDAVEDLVTVLIRAITATDYNPRVFNIAVVGDIVTEGTTVFQKLSDENPKNEIESYAIYYAFAETMYALILDGRVKIQSALSDNSARLLNPTDYGKATAHLEKGTLRDSLSEEFTLLAGDSPLSDKLKVGFSTLTAALETDVTRTGVDIATNLRKNLDDVLWKHKVAVVGIFGAIAVATGYGIFTKFTDGAFTPNLAQNLGAEQLKWLTDIAPVALLKNFISFEILDNFLQGYPASVVAFAGGLIVEIVRRAIGISSKIGVGGSVQRTLSIATAIRVIITTAISVWGHNSNVNDWAAVIGGLRNDLPFLVFSPIALGVIVPLVADPARWAMNYIYARSQKKAISNVVEKRLGTRYADLLDKFNVYDAALTLELTRFDVLVSTIISSALLLGGTAAYYGVMNQPWRIGLALLEGIVTSSTVMWTYKKASLASNNDK